MTPQLKNDTSGPRFARVKLTVGLMRDAWHAFPQQRSQLLRMPAGPPIFVTGTHRSGTTWAAKMLAIPGMWYVHEPFNPNKGMWSEPFPYVPVQAASPSIDAMMRRILCGGYRQALNIPHTDRSSMPLRWMPLRPRRVLLKDPLACLLTGYLAERFGFQTLVLFRHPCGFVASVLRLGWPTAGFLGMFLNRPALMDEQLAPYADLMQRHSTADTIESAAVLHGVLNQVLWNQTTQLGLQWYRFEDLCADPLERFAELFAWLDLPYTESTRADHASLCFADVPAGGEYHPHAVRRRSGAMADGWRMHLTQEDVQRVREVWQHFDVPLYSDNSDWIRECSSSPLTHYRVT